MTDITRKRGDTYADEYIIKNRSTGGPLDLTGHSFKMTLSTSRTPTDASTVVYQITGTVIDAAAGRVEFAPTDQQADHVGKYYFDVQMVDGSSRKRTIDAGKYTFTQDITKSP